MIKRLFLAGVIEHHHQLRNRRVQLYSLVVPKSLTQGVAAIVALEVDGPASGFASLFTKRTVRTSPPSLKRRGWSGGGIEASKLMDCGHSGFVQRDPLLLTGFLFIQSDFVFGFAVAYLASGEPKEIRGPKVGVDTKV
jgi:hypothetical protein